MNRKYLVCLLVFLVHCERERNTSSPAVPVRTEIARRGNFTPTLTLLGVVRAAESIPLTAQQRGTIRYPRRFAGGLQTGVKVSSGELLAEITNDDLQAAATESKLEMDALAADFARADRSYKLGVISSAEYEAARVRSTLARERYNAATRRVGGLRIVAPASGVLVVTKVVPAESVVEALTPLAEIATGGAPRVESSAAASERALLHPGLAVAFTAHDTPPWNGQGRISEVAAVVGESGTSRIVAEITPHGGTPAPGTGVELTVALEPRTSVLTVPEDAIVPGVAGPALFVAATSEGRANAFRVKRVPVETGGRANGRIEILSGLHDGDRVVVSGADSLTDNAVAAEVTEKGGE